MLLKSRFDKVGWILFSLLVSVLFFNWLWGFFMNSLNLPLIVIGIILFMALLVNTDKRNKRANLPKTGV
jgi:hypothetical protein